MRFSNGAMLSMLPQGPSNSTANVTDHLIVIALEALMDDNNKLGLFIINIFFVYFGYI